MPAAKRGLLVNPDAVNYLLGDRSQAWLARESHTTEANVSAMLAGSKGVRLDVAERIAEALAVPLGVVFPEAVNFGTEIRVFTASGGDDNGKVVVS
jgi:hypothetical protein